MPNVPIILVLTLIISYFISFFLLSDKEDNKGIQSLILFLIILSFVSAYIYFSNSINNLKIETVTRRIKDLSNEYSSVTIKNNNNHPVFLKRIYLSDGEKYDEFSFEDIYIDSLSSYDLLMNYDQGIELSKSKETELTVSLTSKKIIDRVLVPGLGKNETYCVSENIIKNNNENKEYLPSPVFSKTSGYYDEAFNLEIESDYDIYYTTDGSDPDINANKYENSIYVYNVSDNENVYRNIPYVIKDYNNFIQPEKVDKIFVVRAIAIDKDGNKSKIETNSYVIDLPQYKNRNVISLVTDPKNLFDRENGIYVVGKEYEEKYENNLIDSSKSKKSGSINYWKRGKETEREAVIEMIDNDGLPKQNIGIRIRGNFSADNALKRFGLYCREEYSGSDYLNGDIFGDYDIHSFIIRTGENHAIINELVDSKVLTTAKCIPVEVFIDGEYWYSAYIIENLKEEFFKNHYDLNENNILISVDGFVDKSDPNSDKGLLNFNLETFLSNNEISDPKNYEKLNEMIDIQSYIEYNVVNIFVANHDYKETWNTRAWRTAISENTEYGDGRFRWMLYDMDLLNELVKEKEGLKRSCEIDSFTMVREEWGVLDSIYYQPVFGYLIFNEEFRKDFVNTFMDYVNTTFEIKHVEKVLNELGLDISYDDYFYRDRAEYILPYLEKYFELEEKPVNIKISANKNDASINLNSVRLNLNENFKGQYYKKYPITLNTDDSGFKYWLIDGVKYPDRNIEIFVHEGLDVVACY